MNANPASGLHPSRRSVLRAAFAAGTISLLAAALASCVSGPRRETIVVAGGEPGGFYLEFATLLAASLQRHQVARTATVNPTGGSLDNVAQLLSGEATLAVALADAASLEGGPQGKHPGQIAALGKVYQNYVHAVVRKDGSITSLDDLAGRTVAVGMPGSGTSLITPRLFEVAGLKSAPAGTPAAGRDVIVKALGLNDGVAALAAGEVDALFWSGGVPTAAIAQAHTESAFALLDLSSLLPGLRERYGAFYDKVLIPGDSYPGIDAVWTIGVANLLLCRTDLDAETVRQTVDLLVGHADELIPRSSVGVQFLSPDSLINTADVPLHPAAAQAYRKLHG
ncbi:TAXI family TRAP transporter solute-binding subunit [Paeniglutamicibacter sp. ZC-3]|uniref:TAXI family TRAP transporter solute-binding subunit n=1 Tax=Paeniglutamicibacter sp. ZC-3 TaxID=2986919 RepID=UPI0021F6CA50|nr:TAXI family TRAP transporter solute-binding subunit [Paeniglutamicibacter sp. ZC-3]MCV9994274.1 TAXI family TRAP transporter solute-binding subunit [Paeniglutamicibacter sp. ZC-3]